LISECRCPSAGIGIGCETCSCGGTLLRRQCPRHGVLSPFQDPQSSAV
jgi:hypothetical protein